MHGTHIWNSIRLKFRYYQTDVCSSVHRLANIWTSVLITYDNRNYRMQNRLTFICVANPLWFKCSTNYLPLLTLPMLILPISPVMELTSLSATVELNSVLRPLREDTSSLIAENSLLSTHCLHFSFACKNKLFVRIKFFFYIMEFTFCKIRRIISPSVIIFGIHLRSLFEVAHINPLLLNGEQWLSTYQQTACSLSYHRFPIPMWYLCTPNTDRHNFSSSRVLVRSFPAECGTHEGELSLLPVLYVYSINKHFPFWDINIGIC